MPKTHQPISRNLELEALREAVRWPNPSPRTVLALVGQLLAARRHEQGRALFTERSEQVPDQPLYVALAGFFQALTGEDLDHALDLLDRAVDRAPGVTSYLRGLILAQLPASLGKAQAAVADLELVLALPESAGFPVGFRRAVYPALATAYAALGRAEDARAARDRAGPAAADPDYPALVTDWWVTRDDGFHFGPARLVELAPGVHVAQGFDFADVVAIQTRVGRPATGSSSTSPTVASRSSATC